MNDYGQRTSTRCLVFVEWLNVGISSVRGAVHNWFAHHPSVCVVYRAVCSHVYAPDVFPSQARRGRPSLGRGALGWDVAAAEGWRWGGTLWSGVGLLLSQGRNATLSGRAAQRAWDGRWAQSPWAWDRLWDSPRSMPPRVPKSSVWAGRAQGRRAVGPADSVGLGSPLAAVIQAQHSGHITCTRLIP